MEAAWSKIRPYPDEQVGNRRVIINPFLGGYKCFYHPEIPLNEYSVDFLVHRWVWTNAHGRKPLPGHHIHHIDEDKYNNDPKNLEEVEGTEHYEKHRRGL